MCISILIEMQPYTNLTPTRVKQSINPHDHYLNPDKASLNPDAPLLHPRCTPALTQMQPCPKPRRTPTPT